MQGCKRGALLALMACAFLAGCAARRQPLVFIDAGEPGRDPALRVAQLYLGEDLHWRLANGESGVGKLLSVEADTLVFVERPRARPSNSRLGLEAGGAARRPRRIAHRDVVALTRWDPQARPYIAGAFAAPVILFVIIALLFQIDPPTWPTN